MNTPAPLINQAIATTVASTDNYLLSLLLIVPFVAFFLIWLVKDRSLLTLLMYLLRKLPIIYFFTAIFKTIKLNLCIVT